MTHPHLEILATRRATMIMAKDSDGRKFNRIPEYNRVQDGKTIHVSTLNTQSILSSCHSFSLDYFSLVFAKAFPSRHHSTRQGTIALCRLFLAR